VTRSVRFHPLATAEVVDAQLWYDEQASGLGDRFLESLRPALDRVVAWPAAGSPTSASETSDVIERRMAIGVFPYLVVYRIGATSVDVLAVHHERRRPMYWADRSMLG